MKKIKKATSIIEAMIIMLIVVNGVVGMYSLYNRSQNLSIATKNRIEAIQMAREWIEAVTNIRNTNALLFQADMENCWNVMNYDINCIASSGTGTDIPHNASFIIRRDSDNRWILTETWAWLVDYSDINYRNTFQVNMDSDGFYTQSGGLAFRPTFTREIQIKYEDTNGGWNDENDEKMWVSSIVRWSDNASTKPYEVKLETLLSNRKKGG